MFGFINVEMSDHKLARLVKGATYKHNGSSVTWYRGSEAIAVVFYDNSLLTRDVWINTTVKEA